MHDWHHVISDYGRIKDRERDENAANARRLELSRAQQVNSFGDTAVMPGSAANRLDLGSFTGRTTQAAQAYWWVPAGFAVLVLLRTILGA